MNLAKAVASATAALVLQAKKVASQSTEQGVQNQVIASATLCAMSTSQLVACTKVCGPYWSTNSFTTVYFKVVGPTISNPSCQEQLVEAAQEVSQSVEGCVGASEKATTDSNLLQLLGDAAAAVGAALDDLVNHIKQVSAC